MAKDWLLSFPLLTRLTGGSAGSDEETSSASLNSFALFVPTTSAPVAATAPPLRCRTKVSMSYNYEVRITPRVENADRDLKDLICSCVAKLNQVPTEVQRMMAFLILYGGLTPVTQSIDRVLSTRCSGAGKISFAVVTSEQNLSDIGIVEELGVKLTQSNWYTVQFKFVSVTPSSCPPDETGSMITKYYAGIQEFVTMTALENETGIALCFLGEYNEIYPADKDKKLGPLGRQKDKKVKKVK